MARNDEMNPMETPPCARSAIDLRNELEDSFLNAPSEEFDRVLRIASQQTARARRGLDLSDPAVQAAYYTGYQSGCEEILMALFRERAAQRNIQSALDADPGMEALLRFLASKDRPVRHVDMAEALHMEYGSLTRAMAPMLLCRAAEAYRTGKNTRYGLTPSAYRFCARKGMGPVK